MNVAMIVYYVIIFSVFITVLVSFFILPWRAEMKVQRHLSEDIRKLDNRIACLWLQMSFGPNPSDDGDWKRIPRNFCAVPL